MSKAIEQIKGLIKEVERKSNDWGCAGDLNKQSMYKHESYGLKQALQILEAEQQEQWISDEEIVKIGLEKYPVRECYYGDNPNKIDDNFSDRFHFMEGMKAYREYKAKDNE